MPIVRCAACDGYGWLDDEDEGEIECRWCGGIGYVYRDERGIDQRIPESDYERQSETLERLEIQRLREIGYTGQSKKPWDQEVRQKRGNLLNGDPPEST